MTDTLMPNMGRLFEQHYPMGTEVIAIDEEDLMVKGKVTHIEDSGITIQCLGLKPDTITWANLRFISHDGYPVREVNAPHMVNSEEKITQLRLDLQRARLSPPLRRYARFGDPFELEAAEIVPAYLGHGGYTWVDSWESEVLVCTADDGALAMLWDFDSVYELQ